MRDKTAPEYFGSILARRISRRELLSSSGIAATAGIAAFALPGAAAALSSMTAATRSQSSPVASAVLQAIAPSKLDAIVLSPGLRHQLLIGAGDALFADERNLTTKDLATLEWLNEDGAQRQARQFGANNDALAFFVKPGEPDSAVLCVNHEYVQAELNFSGLPRSGRERAQGREAWIKAHPAAVTWMKNAHGVSVLELKKTADGWQVQKSAPLTRRITAATPMQIHGPARGHALMQTKDDPTGTRVLGTFANCAGGKTPWGTYLTAEENIEDYFGNAQTWAKSSEDERLKEAHRRLPARERSVYGWDHLEARFDVVREPREAFRHGWIVEIDPLDPTSTPKKRTALGRFSHEGASPILTRDGRVAAYMGDDDKFEYVYKFVTRDRYNAQDRRANLDLLDHGTLYVARFDESGEGEWLPLVYDEAGPLNSKTGFADQGDVVIKCRAAADILGATPMDRPEDVEPNPVTGHVYMALTKNSDRKNDQKMFNGREINLGPDAANPRPENDYGHIIELIEEDDDAASTRFRWNLFLLAGDPRRSDARFITQAEDLVAGDIGPADCYYAGFGDASAVSPIACPDNVGFDPSGRLWIVTDSGGSVVANDGCFVVPTSGPERGRLVQIASAPVGAEICGCEFTPDGQTLFLAIQHPGEGGSVDSPVSHWPDGNGLPARSAVIAISREDGQPL
jgi:uncharacterized protein